jgi:calcineurin-like phosphoesterase family protein
MPAPPPNFGAKDLGQYRQMGRGAVIAYFRKLAAKVGHPPDARGFERLTAFASTPANALVWLRHVLHFITKKKHPFQTYPDGGGVYTFQENLKLSLAGDWGTGTDEAQQVANQMVTHDPDFTIHLGDVYYVGDQPELEVNCLGIDGPRHKGVKWRHGKGGSFALSGNHEMYARDDAYFTQFLPTLGVIDPATGKTSGQGASFFCLQNKYWRIIGLDTGYNSAGFRSLLDYLGRFKFLPFLRKSTWFKPTCKLRPELMQWLEKLIVPNPDGTSPATVLLSHHQYFSSFDDWYRIPGQQLRKFFADRKVIWFWGHEHRFSMYDCFGVENGIQAFGRCIGHGGMPVDRAKQPDILDCNCILYDDRPYPNNENINVGFNGFCTMTFTGATLSVNYYDLHNKLLLTESWQSDPQGQLTGPHFSNVDPALNQRDPQYINSHS